MTHGGKREGAGRKIGTRSRASVEREKRVAASGATPLEIMLQMMRESYADVQSIARRLKAITGRGGNDQAREAPTACGISLPAGLTTARHA